MTFVRGDIFRVISAVHPMLWDAARDRRRLVIEAVDWLAGIARVAFLDAEGRKVAAAAIGVKQLEAAFLLREDLASTAAEEPVAAENVEWSHRARPLARPAPRPPSPITRA